VTSATTQPVPVLRLERLTKRFRNITAVDDISFEVFEGDVFGFLGPNGAGKSTTLYMVAGLVSPTSGNIEIFGRPHTDVLAVRSRIGALLETPAFYDYLSGRKNLELLARLQPDIERRRVDEVLELVGLSARARDRVGDYSHGMKQRLGIAQTLLNRPRLLLLDEPTSGLDPEGSAQIWALLRRLVEQESITVVISSHLLHEVEEGCNRIAVINQGMIVACDEVRNLLFFSKDDYLVVFDAPQAARAAETLLRAQDGVEVLATGDEAGEVVTHARDGYILWVRVQEGMAPAVLSGLVTAGLTPREFVRQRKTLKQFFFDLTRRQPARA
jgi:ABC-2 type transport system ATP-binding protein